VQALVVSKALNVGTMQGLAALSKAKPGTLNYSTGSVPFGVSSIASTGRPAPTSCGCRSAAAARR